MELPAEDSRRTMLCYVGHMPILQAKLANVSLSINVYLAKYLIALLLAFIVNILNSLFANLHNIIVHTTLEWRNINHE